MSDALPVRVPAVGQSATEVRLVEWCAAAGDEVKQGQVIALVETDKTTVEVEAPADGTLGPLLAAVDDLLDLGADLTTVTPTHSRVHTVRNPDPMYSGMRISPRARRRAADLGVDLAQVEPTGEDGLITEADVDRAAGRTGSEADVAQVDPDQSGTEVNRAAGRSAAAPVAGSPASWQGRAVAGRQPLGPIPRTAARRLAESWRAAPHIVQLIDADLTEADSARRAAGATWTEVAVHALAQALVAHPHLNAAIDGDDLVTFAEINIGVAVDTDRGLLVPVVHGADRLSLAEVTAAVRDLAGRARAGALTPVEMAGGTATVSNLGAFGITAGTPVLNPPESVLLFLGAVEDRPAVVDGRLAVRPMATLSLAFDHRTTDGAAAARFSAAVRDRLQTPSE